MANEDQVQRALVKIKQIQAKIEELNEAMKNLKGFVAENIPEGETEHGVFKVNVYTYKKYDEAYGKKNAPELWEEFAVEKLVLDSKRAKDVLNEDQYALFQKPSAGGKSVTVKLKDEDD